MKKNLHFSFGGWPGYGVIFLFILLNPGFLEAQELFSGRVTGTDGQPLAGVTVAVKGKQTAVSTRENGEFNINAFAGEYLLFTFVGYACKQVRLVENKFLDISLSSLVINLDEILVTGYTSQKIKEITGSAALVKPGGLTAMPAGRVELLLQGRVAGLNVISSGSPGRPNNIICDCMVSVEKKAAEPASKSASKHKSMGLKITANRIVMMQQSNVEKSTELINALVNDEGSAAGTEVVIKMTELHDLIHS